jgi:thioredoxin-related protein
MGRPTTIPGIPGRLFSAWILAWLAIGSAAAGPVPAAADLAADARILRERQVPMMMLYSRSNCGWCEKVRQLYLASIAADPKAEVVLRQIDLDRDTPLVDFSGRRTSHRQFAQAHKVKLAPTLMFFGPDGGQLVEAIVGYRLPDFYGAHIDDAIEDSRNRLRGTPQ